MSQLDDAIEYFYDSVAEDAGAEQYKDLNLIQKKQVKAAYNKAALDLTELLYGSSYVHGDDMNAFLKDRLEKVLNKWVAKKDSKCDTKEDDVRNMYNIFCQHELTGYQHHPIAYKKLSKVKKRKFKDACKENLNHLGDDKEFAWNVSIDLSSMFLCYEDAYLDRKNPVEIVLKREDIERRVVKNFDEDFRAKFEMASEEEKKQFFDEYMQQPHIMEQMRIYGT